MFSPRCRGRGRRWASGRWPGRGCRRSAGRPRPAPPRPCRSTVISKDSAVLISGTASGGNSTSITGPAMATTRPSFSVGWFSVTVMCGISGSGGSGDGAWACCGASTVSTTSRALSARRSAPPVWPWRRASAPPTISMISVVMASWRARFITRLSLVMSSSALSVADFMARCWAACSRRRPRAGRRRAGPRRSGAAGGSRISRGRARTRSRPTGRRASSAASSARSRAA